MSQVLVTESYLEDIADAIREKNGTENTYKPGQMAAAIEALPDPSVLDSKSITANGTYDPSDDDLDGYDEVTVNVPNSYAAGDEGKVVSNGALVAQTARSSDITENGTYDTTLNDEVTVNVSGGGGGTGVAYVIETKSTGGYDASLYIRTFTLSDGDMSIDTITLPYGSASSPTEYWNCVTVQYGSGSWKVYATASVKCEGTTYNSGDLIAQWTYSTSKFIQIKKL